MKDTNSKETNTKVTDNRTDERPGFSGEKLGV
jgi:hypothetical protein